MAEGLGRRDCGSGCGISIHCHSSSQHRTYLQARQRKALWEQELRRFLELEEAAGRLTEELSTYELRGSTEGEQNFWAQLNWLKVATGRFRRYAEVHTALREFNHAAADFYQVDKRTGSPKEYDEQGAALELAYTTLIKAADTATHRPKGREA